MLCSLRLTGVVILRTLILWVVICPITIKVNGPGGDELSAPSQRAGRQTHSNIVGLHINLTF